MGKDLEHRKAMLHVSRSILSIFKLAAEIYSCICSLWLDWTYRMPSQILVFVDLLQCIKFLEWTHFSRDKASLLTGIIYVDLDQTGPTGVVLSGLQFAYEYLFRYTHTCTCIYMYNSMHIYTHMHTGRHLYMHTHMQSVQIVDAYLIFVSCVSFGMIQEINWYCKLN